jgi:CheY-like chemotaxis protein
MSVSFGSVLVVNDVEINLVVAQELLESYKLQVDTSISGIEAYEKIKSGCIYDIIFMDNMMPQMDGIETTRKIRDSGYNGKIVMLTGNDFNMDGEIGKLFDGHLLNPVDAEKLEDILDRFIPIIRMSDSPQSKSDRSRLMRAFRRDSQKAIASLQENLKHPGCITDIKSLTSTFHAMKTALANIGNEDESRLAYDLEKAGSTGDVPYIMENVNKFLTILQELSCNIEEDTEIRNLPNSEDTEVLLTELNLIKSACDDYDIHEVEANFSALLNKPLKNSTRSFLEEMRDLIYSDSDFDTVSENISGFISTYIAVC